MILAGIGAALFAVFCTFLLTGAYVAVLQLLTPGSARVDPAPFPYVMAVFGLPVLFFLATMGAAALATRRFASDHVTHGAWIGAVTALVGLVIGRAAGPLNESELLLYPLICICAGYLGGVLGREAEAGREALYKASREISSARGPREIAAAIGEHLRGSRTRQIALWRVVSGDDDPHEVELLGSWTPQGQELLPPGRRMSAADVPALVHPRRQSPVVTSVSALRPAGREPWEREGFRSVALIPLSTAGDGPDALLTVASRESRASLRRRMRLYMTIGAQAALALENQRLVEAARRAGVLGERQRLSFEIHDTLVQGFSSIVMNLETAEASLPSDPDTAQKNLNLARDTARESLREARRLVWALKPEPLEEAPLAEALRRLAARLSTECATQASVTVTGAPRRLSPDAEVTLLRAAQESLSNVRKHARAKRVVLTLSYMSDGVTLDARDDGVGFVPENLDGAPGKEGGGFGLGAMRQRAARIGGTLRVESRPAEGAALTVELPTTADTDENAGVGARMVEETP